MAGTVHYEEYLAFDHIDLAEQIFQIIDVVIQHLVAGFVRHDLVVAPGDLGIKDRIPRIQAELERHR